MSYWPLFVGLGAIVCMGVAMLLLTRRWHRALAEQDKKMLEQNKQLKAIKVVLKATQHQNETLQSQVHDVVGLFVDAEKKIQQLEQMLQHMQARQDEVVVESDPSAKLYQRAMKMVALGADVDEVIRECELPKAEAQLLVNLHRSRE
ncbi:MAG: DUF2802 domain-containing protein [Ferrimonas sp.]